MDENGQISAEMILIMGALLIIVIVAGGFIFNICYLQLQVVFHLILIR